MKATIQDNCRKRTNVLHSTSEEGFNQAGFQKNIPQRLLKYLKQQSLLPVPLLPAMQEIQEIMEEVLSRNDLIMMLMVLMVLMAKRTRHKKS